MANPLSVQASGHKSPEIVVNRTKQPGGSFFASNYWIKKRAETPVKHEEISY
jgi:hypothetical protein